MKNNKKEILSKSPNTCAFAKKYSWLKMQPTVLYGYGGFSPGLMGKSSGSTGT